MPSIDEAVRQITASGAPVLFLDTCILLDIIRSTERCLKNYTTSASELLRLTSNAPPTCLLVASSIVFEEWAANVQRVTNETIRHLNKMEEQSSHFHTACQEMGVAVPFGRAGYAQVGLAEMLRNLSDQVLNKALRLDRDNEIWARALARVVDNLPPSRKGGEVKDCAIIEECLAVCGLLRAAGFTGKRVFCTSNTEDYCEAGGKPHPSLANEFTVNQLTFTTNLPWAIHEITH
jgi:hypothetical protein